MKKKNFCANVGAVKGFQRSAGEKSFKRRERGLDFFGHVVDRASDPFFAFFEPFCVSISFFFPGTCQYRFALLQEGPFRACFFFESRSSSAKLTAYFLVWFSTFFGANSLWCKV